LIGVEYDVYHSVMYFPPILRLWEIVWSCWTIYSVDVDYSRWL